jgi:eukaryotic-like serine/threonine-protein kinase
MVALALFAGSLPNSVSAAHAFSLTGFEVDGVHTIRLALQATALLALGLFSARAMRRMPDDGKGYSFLRQLVLPITTLLMLVVADNTLHLAGLPLIDRWGEHRYMLAYAAGLLLAGLWISAAWLLNLDSLYRFFAPAALPHRHPSSSSQDSCSISLDHEAGDTQASTVILTRNGGPPTTLGRYKVVKEIGRGAMGVVYLGKDPTIQRFVAIKTMRLDENADPEKLQEVKTRFFREAESTGRLSHPNIVTIHDAGEEQGLGYIAMEMLEGTTLTHWSRQPSLMPLSQLMLTLATVAEALDYAHQQGVVHRDIKPANIMLTKDALIKVMDFGIAKFATSSTTRTDIVLGTPTYMSPEQIAGKKIDGRSDIFSLGVVLFELLTGRPPFTAHNVSALLFAIAHTPPSPLVTFRSDLPPMVQDVLDQALQKNLVHRYCRALDLAQALRTCVEGSGTGVGHI